MNIKSFNEFLVETTLSRVWEHFTDEARPAGIATAYILDVTDANNADRMKQLAGDVRGAGFGYIFLNGVYTYDNGVVMSEPSIAMWGDAKDNGKLKGCLRQWRERYDQEAVLYKPTDSTHVFALRAGEEIDIGVFHPGQIWNNMSRLHGRGARSFMFKEAYTSMNWMSRVLHDSLRRRRLAGSER